MSRIGWAGLLRVGVGQLRLTPEQFWALTPAEFMMMAGIEGPHAAMGRARLDALLAAFPDGEEQDD